MRRWKDVTQVQKRPRCGASADKLAQLGYLHARSIRAGDDIIATTFHICLVRNKKKPTGVEFANFNGPLLRAVPSLRHVLACDGRDGGRRYRVSSREASLVYQAIGADEELGHLP